ncbi:hypothetical protein H072_7383 [Dactylellina haptotyla CBS 200.50]|uniref:Peptidase metallopeptidase domain-containing protein n=1 Tax=Dactylellina haptotyla (strain CBS 200.50) TaxID=1284197 RepID=S8A7S4_DACHA|nr:hypothetical protein H072_7383 [Dactylellina haptotyla CBS 200.50]
MASHCPPEVPIQVTVGDHDHGHSQVKSHHEGEEIKATSSHAALRTTDPETGLPWFPMKHPPPLKAAPSPHDDGLTCSMPPMQPERRSKPLPGGLGAVFAKSLKWPNGLDTNDTAKFPFKIDIKFLEGTDAQKKKVQNYAVPWLRWAPALYFTWDDAKESTHQVRIKFDTKDGSWSQVGINALGFPDQDQQTMNFGWVQSTPVATEKEIRTILHEFGHAIGLEHELGNPNVGQIIHWDKEKVYQYYWETNKWDRKEVDLQIFTVYDDPNSFSWTDMDTDSIMMYTVPKGLTTDNWYYNKLNWQLSKLDEDHMSEMYALKVKMASISVFKDHGETLLTIYQTARDSSTNVDPREDYTRVVYERSHKDGLVKPSTSNSAGWSRIPAPPNTGATLVHPVVEYHSVVDGVRDVVFLWSIDEKKQLCAANKDRKNNYYTYWSGRNHDAPLATSVAVGGMYDFDMHVFVISTDRYVWELILGGKSAQWTKWTRMPNISNAMQISVVFNNRNSDLSYKQTLDIFVLDLSGSVWLTSYDYEVRTWNKWVEWWALPSEGVYTCANPNGAQVFIIDEDATQIRMYVGKETWKDPAYLTKIPFGKFKQLAVPSVWLNQSTQIVALDANGDTWIFTDVQNLANWNGKDSAWRPLAAPKNEEGAPIFPRGKWAKRISAQQSNEAVDLQLGYRFIAVGIDDYVYTLYTRPGLAWTWTKLY